MRYAGLMKSMQRSCEILYELFCELYEDELAQTTTEYVLMISIVLGVALLVIRDLVQPVMKLINEQISKQIEDRLFKPGSFHRLSL